MALTLPAGSLLYIDTSTTGTPTWTKLTEHNRNPVSMDSNRIEQVERMANGTMRKVFIADKTSIQASWSIVPSYATMTVDGGYGAAELQAFYLAKGAGTFKVKISYNNANTSRDQIKTMFFTSASFTINKRNVRSNVGDVGQEFWDVSISLEEV